MALRLLCAALTAAVLTGAAFPGPVAARDTRDAATAYESDLRALARALGTLHHIRPLCVPDERMLWRDTMKELIRHEDPSRRQAAAMTQEFNDGYAEARNRFESCTPQAESEARIQAEQAALISARLNAALDEPPMR